jgi:hypothetical protein
MIEGYGWQAIVTKRNDELTNSFSSSQILKKQNPALRGFVLTIQLEE